MKFGQSRIPWFEEIPENSDRRCRDISARLAPLKNQYSVKCMTADQCGGSQEPGTKYKLCVEPEQRHEAVEDTYWRGRLCVAYLRSLECFKCLGAQCRASNCKVNREEAAKHVQNLDSVHNLSTSITSHASVAWIEEMVGSVGQKVLGGGKIDIIIYLGLFTSEWWWKFYTHFVPQQQ